MSALLLLVKVGLVFGLLAAVLWLLKRTDGLGGRARGRLEVRGSTRLGKGAALTVVRLDGKDLLLGVTDHAVTLLSSEPASEEPAAAAEAPAKGLPALLREALTARQEQHDLPADDVAAALALARTAPAPAARATDGSAAPRTLRTDARRILEHPWSRAFRSLIRTADGGDGLR
jgi:flagellar biogenesis protein FliO